MVLKAVNVDMAPLLVNVEYKLCEFLQVHFPNRHEGFQIDKKNYVKSMLP